VGEVIKLASARRLVPFLDFAIPGLREGIERGRGGDTAGFAEAMPLMLVANSFSKSFSLYGERVGALSVVAADKDEAARV